MMVLLGTGPLPCLWKRHAYAALELVPALSEVVVDGLAEVGLGKVEALVVRPGCCSCGRFSVEAGGT